MTAMKYHYTIDAMDPDHVGALLERRFASDSKTAQRIAKTMRKTYGCVTITTQKAITNPGKTGE